MKKKSQMILSYVCEKKNKLWFMHELYKVSVVFHWVSSLRQCSGFRFWNLTSSSLSSTCHLSTRYQISSLPAFYSAVSVRFWDASLLTFSNGGGKKWPVQWRDPFESTGLSYRYFWRLSWLFCPKWNVWVWDLFVFVSTEGSRERNAA